MAETALAVSAQSLTDISKLDKRQLRAWRSERDKDRLAELLKDGSQKSLDLLKLMLSQPVTTAIAGVTLAELLGRLKLLDDASVNFFQGMIIGAGTIEIFISALNPFD